MIDNPFQMNDWGIKKFLKLVLGVQFAILGLVGLAALGFDMHGLRQIVGFIYLTFIPGLIILRILKMHRLGTIKTILYSVGLSIVFLMFFGFLINMSYPYLGIFMPISTLSLTISVTVVLLLLCIVAYIRDKDYASPAKLNMGIMLSPSALFLCLLPFLSIFGTYLLNNNRSNIVQIIFLIIIAVVVTLIAFRRFISSDLYPLAVFTISLSLLFHASLTSLYLSGWDARVEYYMSNLVLTNGIWNPLFPADAYNSMLSVTMLPPIYSLVLNVDVTWVFKVIWTVIFALAPLGLYHIFRKQVNSKVAFLAVFLVVFMAVNYCQITMLPRQEIAMFFYVLLIVLMVERKTDLAKRTALFVTFGLALIVSHYAVSYLFMFICIAALLISTFFLGYKSRVLTNGFVVLFVVSVLAWYIYTSRSVLFIALLDTGQHVLGSLVSELFNPQSREVVFISAQMLGGALHEIERGLVLLVSFFIAVGILDLLLHRKQVKFHEEYIAFALVNFAVLVGCVIIPAFSDTTSVERIYSLTLLFLAPFCILGGAVFFKLLGMIPKYIQRRVYHIGQTDGIQGRYLNDILAILLVALFLFSSGVPYAVAGESRLRSTLDTSGGNIWAWFNHKEISGGLWLLSNMDESEELYCDDSGRRVFVAYRGTAFAKSFVIDEEDQKLRDPVSEYGYIYLRGFNISNRVVLTTVQTRGSYKRTVVEVNMDHLITLDDRNKIYTNSGAEVYKDMK